jgi:hypothetical protein
MDAPPSTQLVAAYLNAAGLAIDLVADPAVRTAWRQPSALVGFGVAGLAGHLASQVFSVEQTLAAPVRDAPVADVLQHYGQVAWVGAAPEDEISVSIREGGDQLSVEGREVLVERARSSWDRVAQALPRRSLDELVQPVWLGWSLRLRDFLTTRLVEVVVHCDDLAVSVGVATPTFPPEVIEPVFGLLTSLAARRHGQPAVLRALSRAERAPSAINAI